MTHTHSLPGRVRVADLDQLLDAMGRNLLRSAREAVEHRGVFHLALSGGSTPKPFYELLVICPTYRDLPWDRTHIWIVDERQVPETDEKSNVRMIRQTLTGHVPIRDRQVHAVPVEADQPGLEYENQLKDTVDGQGIPRLDFILLGMGDDAHTASLFPESPALNEADRLIVENDGPRVVPPPRVTMTYPLINAGRQVAVLAVGKKKAATIERVAAAHAAGTADPQQLPITGIRPDPGLLSWYLDYDAAGEESAA